MPRPSHPPASAEFEPGDVVYAGDGRLWVRTTHPLLTWGAPEGPTRRHDGTAVIPAGEVWDDEPVRPLRLLIRRGHLVHAAPLGPSS